MTTEKLVKDLQNKINQYNDNFKVKLFKRDLKTYGRRTFDDLFLYYRRHGVTEKQLMKGLVEAGFSALYCSTVKRPTWGGSKSQNKFWYPRINDVYINNFSSQITKNTKYNTEYLNKLYDSIENDKD